MRAGEEGGKNSGQKILFFNTELSEGTDSSEVGFQSSEFCFLSSDLVFWPVPSTSSGQALSAAKGRIEGCVAKARGLLF
jgi:hypothetical protein